jgi:hypothetical protein
VNWAELFVVFVVSHLTGDYLLQTEWQARNKHGGLGRDPVRRRALVSHIAVYTLCFVPGLIWAADQVGAAAAVIGALAIALPHLVVDDGRLLVLYIDRVKNVPAPVPAPLFAAVDQSTHLVALWVVAVLVA